MALCGAKRPHILSPNVYPEAPDGGWGWAVAAAFFLVEVFTYGTIKSFGIFLQDLMGEFRETNSRVSWVVSICVFVMTFNGPLSSVVTKRFGFQPVVMVGGLLISVSTIATSFAGSINQMYFTYGIVGGLGYSLTFLPTVTILSQYFSRRRSLVTAVASTGESLSMVALAPAFSALKNHIGWRHTMAVMGALQSTVIICGVLLRPIIIKPAVTHKTETDRMSPKEPEGISVQGNIDSVPSNTSDAQDTSHSLDNKITNGSVNTGHSGIQSRMDTDNSSPEQRTPVDKEAEEENNVTQIKEIEKKKDEGMKPGGEKPPEKISKLLDFSVLRDCSFVLYSLFGLFATLGFFAPQLYIIELSVSRGVQRDRATVMLSIMAVAEVFGRFFIGWILIQKQFVKRKLLVLLVCVIIMAADLMGFALVTEFYGLAVCCALYGFIMGTLSCTHIPMLAEDDVVGIERMPSAAGVYVFIQSFAGLAGPPLGGVLVDVTNNYGSAFYSCAAGLALSAVFLGLVRPVKRRFICKKRNSKCPEDVHEGQGNSEEGA